MVRPASRRRQRARPPDPVRPHARTLGSLRCDPLDPACRCSAPPRWAPGCSAQPRWGLLLAWAYSAPPVRLKQNGWWGNLACAAVLRRVCVGHRRGDHGRGTAPSPRIIAVAALYSLGAHGIMTLERFQIHRGRQTLGSRFAAGASRRGTCRRGRMHRHGAAAVRRGRVADCVGRHLSGGRHRRFVGRATPVDERVSSRSSRRAPWYNGTGVGLYVTGMLISAFALKGFAA